MVATQITDASMNAFGQATKFRRIIHECEECCGVYDTPDGFAVCDGCKMDLCEKCQYEAKNPQTGDAIVSCDICKVCAENGKVEDWDEFSAKATSRTMAWRAEGAVSSIKYLELQGS